MTDPDYEYLEETDRSPKADKFDELVRLGLRCCDSSEKSVAWLNTAMKIAERPDLMMSRRTFDNLKNRMLAKAVEKRKSEDKVQCAQSDIDPSNF